MNLAALKASVLSDVLSRGTALIYVDGRGCSGLPPGHCDAICTLRVGYGLTPPISLTLDEHGFQLDGMSFEGVPKKVQVPWPMLFAVMGEGEPSMVVQWPESTPTADGVPVRQPEKSSHLRSI